MMVERFLASGVLSGERLSKFDKNLSHGPKLLIKFATPIFCPECHRAEVSSTNVEKESV